MEDSSDSDDLELFAVLPFLCNEKSLLYGWRANSVSSNSSVSIINDAEVASSVVSIESEECCNKTYVSFPDSTNKVIGTPYPWLMMQIKNVSKFVKIEINVCDEPTSMKHFANNKVQKNTKTFICSNKQSLARLIDNKCSLPLKLESGW
eukprot:CAMPEP_0202690608 /NCGR_PEP_ID=MMETSP1385-20130828/5550_1 /ASSEMBLY_ACC=CAM_ASM_000861 /TAXON_ID=933848 /ORGANISM="Elphidium margaritaceum" /LENGTH=148 /DNA_ID=CAMNT_0049345885 /DNA_START=38 /DNA_END=481 /DNA_ORIENTATION=-